MLFSVIVYFAPGRKYPKIVMNNYEFRMLAGKSNSSKTLWICTQENNKCKVRVKSAGNIIFVKNVQHNHPPSFSKQVDDLKSKVFNIINLSK